jgi:hypothetical protein
MSRTKILILLIMLLTMAVFTSPAGATLLPPGGTVVAAPFSGAPGTLLASNSAPFTSVLGAVDFSGTATEAVYMDSVTRLMDFVYQFVANPGGLKAIEQMTDASYSGFLTDVYQSTGAGTAFGPFVDGDKISTTVTRPVGSTVSWNDSWGPGAVTSAIFLIKTDANAFVPGTISFINQGTATLTDFFAPNTVPEPTFYGLLAAALLGVVWVSRRKISQSVN